MSEKIEILKKYLDSLEEEERGDYEDWVIYTQDEKEKAIEEIINDDLWLFKPEFLSGYSGFSAAVIRVICESNEMQGSEKNEALRQIIDTYTMSVDVSDDCNESGGLLAYCDGTEHEDLMKKETNILLTG